MTVIDNMLKMKKMNGLKIFALILLSLSKFETMFGMEENEPEKDIVDNDYINKNYYLIDDLGNKITLDNGKDIKFKIYSKKEDAKKLYSINEDSLKILEEKQEKILGITMSKKNEKGDEETYLVPIYYRNEQVISMHEDKYDDKIGLVGIALDEDQIKMFGKYILHCNIIKKIGEDSMNDNYILVDAENNKIEKIEDKKIVFKLLTRKKYLELNEKLNNQKNFLKNEEKKYILDDSQKPLFFEVENNKIKLYVKRLRNDLCLAGLDLKESQKTVNFNKTNSIKVSMAKKEEIPIIIKEGVVDSSKCFCGIC